MSSNVQQLDPAQQRLQEEGWSTLVPLDQADTPPFPHEAVIGPLGDMIRAVSKSTETPPELALGAGLAALAAVCQKTFVVEVAEKYQEPLSIWTATALPPGSRKSSVFRTMPGPVRFWESKQAKNMESEIKAANREVELFQERSKHLRGRIAKGKDAEERDQAREELNRLEENEPTVPTTPRLTAQDTTPEHLATMLQAHNERITLLSDEGGVFATMGGRYSNGVANLDIYLQGHAGETVQVDRASKPSVIIDSPALSLGLAVQPSVLAGLNSNPEFKGRGLLARFLFTMPPSNIGRRKLENLPVPDSVTDKYRKMFSALLEIAEGRTSDNEFHSYTLRLTEEAYSEWKRYQMAVEGMMDHGGALEDEREWGGKLPGAVARIAGLLHCAETASEEPHKHNITVETMRHAIQLGELYRDYAVIVFDHMGTDSALGNARKIWSWIERNRNSYFLRSECHAALRGQFRHIRTMEPAFDCLIERGYLQEHEQRQETGKAGRPSIHYQVRPDLSEGWR